jgi:hypothetical protein
MGNTMGVTEELAASNHRSPDESRKLEVKRDLAGLTANPAGRALLAIAIRQIGEAIVITDNWGTIQYVNPAFTRITGDSREEVFSPKHAVTEVRSSRPSLLRGALKDNPLGRGLAQRVAQSAQGRASLHRPNVDHAGARPDSQLPRASMRCTLDEPASRFRGAAGFFRLLDGNEVSDCAAGPCEYRASKPRMRPNRSR